jgi:acyl transferase domain-containing protein
VSGTWITDEQATDPAYYAQHLRQTVRFGDGVCELTQDPTQVLLEVGPGNTLARLARQQADTRAQTILASTRHPREEKSDLAFLLTTLGKLWLAGVDVDWAGFYAGERRHRLPLPTYPFERGRFWIERGGQALAPASPAAALHKKADLTAWFYAPVWKSSPPPRPFRPADLAGEVGTWLLFVDAYGLGAEMAGRLRDAGQTVVTPWWAKRSAPLRMALTPSIRAGGRITSLC